MVGLGFLAVKWGDLIRPNPSRVGVKPVYLLDTWLRDSFRQNKPYNTMNAAHRPPPAPHNEHIRSRGDPE